MRATELQTLIDAVEYECWILFGNWQLGDLTSDSWATNVVVCSAPHIEYIQLIDICLFIRIIRHASEPK